MARFHGEIGYGITVEDPPDSGIWVNNIIEKVYTGSVIRNARNLDFNSQVNGDFRVNNSISIVADAYASQHFFNILYIRWAGGLWTVDEVEVQPPRLILRLGSVYNGPTA